MTLPWVPACGASHSSDGGGNGSGRGGGSGAANGGSGGNGMLVAGAGQGTSGGTAGVVGGSAGRGGSSAAGDGGRGGTAAGGQGGQPTRGGSSGDVGGSSGEMSGAGEGGSEMTGGTGGGSGASCRTYATEFTVNGAGAFTTVTCAFERASLTQTCTTDIGGVTATIWATIEDAVGENSPLGTRRIDRTEDLVVFTGGAPDCRLTRDYQYDSSMRLTAIVVTIDPDAPCGTNEVTYDAWDPDGRPTHGIETGVGGELCAEGDMTLAYDDELRTITTTRSGGTDCPDAMNVLNHDEDGLRTISANGPNVITYETLATGEICE